MKSKQAFLFPHRRPLLRLETPGFATELSFCHHKLKGSEFFYGNHKVTHAIYQILR